MKKLILFIVALLFTVIAFAADIFTFTQKNWEARDSACVAVPNMTRSQTVAKATSKIVNDDNVSAGTYFLVLEGSNDCSGAHRVIKHGGVIEPPVVVVPSVEPPVVEPITCNAPQVNINDLCVTTDESCQAAGFDRADGAMSSCINDPVVVPPVVVEPPVTGVIQRGDKPAVDTAFNMAKATGFSDIRVRATNETRGAGNSSGEFRIECKPSHMGNFDPIVYPNQDGVSHHHTFFGNVDASASSTNQALVASGNSTCNGGIMNRSSYWVPSLIDTKTNKPIVPKYNVIYYKTAGDKSKTIAPPEGLRMIAGYAGAKTPQASAVRFTCNQEYNTRSNAIVDCNAGGTLDAMLSFPNCWDGVNLDSPDHKSHMDYGEWGVCPASHPVQIPVISFNVHWPVGPDGTTNYRLASDNYVGGRGGASMHGDWMNGWNEVFSEGFTETCLRAGRDCSAHLLGDGRMFY